MEVSNYLIKCSQLIIFFLKIRSEFDRKVIIHQILELFFDTLFALSRRKRLETLYLKGMNVRDKCLETS